MAHGSGASLLRALCALCHRPSSARTLRLGHSFHCRVRPVPLPLPLASGRAKERKNGRTEEELWLTAHGPRRHTKTEKESRSRYFEPLASIPPGLGLFVFEGAFCKFPDTPYELPRYVSYEEKAEYLIDKETNTTRSDRNACRDQRIIRPLRTLPSQGCRGTTSAFRGGRTRRRSLGSPADRSKCARAAASPGRRART